MKPDDLLSLTLEKAWNLFINEPKFKYNNDFTFHEEMAFYQGFNFACYLLTKGD
jgi:hypothetical protein